MKRLVAGCVLAIGCAHGDSERSYAADIERVIAQANRAPVKRIEEPATNRRPRLVVGQWALYELAVDGRRSYVKISFVLQDRCGAWVETLYQSEHHRELVKVCVSPPRSDAGLGDAVQMIVRQRDDHEPEMLDLRARQDVWMMRRVIGPAAPVFSIRDPAMPIRYEPVRVPGGEFAAAIRWERAHEVAWFHDDVPFGGAIKLENDNGFRVTLLAYDHRGATSQLPHPIR